MTTAFKHSLIGLASLLGVASGALGQDYPNKPVKLLVGYPTGGSPDLVARIVGEELSKILGQPFVIDNKPGASGTLASAAAAKSAADGYTLLIAETGQIAIAPNIVKVPYDSIKDFTHVSLLARNPMFMVANSGTQIRTIRDLVREANANPGKLNYASVGIGSIVHLAMEVFNNSAGVNLTHIPYLGSPKAVPALVSGEVQVMAASAPVWGPHAQAGKVNVLAVMAGTRHPNFPDVPALTEIIKGHDDFTSENGLMAPAGIPAEALSKLSKAAESALATPVVKARLQVLGFIPTWSTPAGYTDNIRQNLKKYERAVRISKIKPE